MEAKQKANELYEMFYYSIPSFTDEGQMEHETAKKCALITVDEIIAALEDYGQDTMELQNMDRTFAWYYKVKEEIENL